MESEYVDCASSSEFPVVFKCEGTELIGIVNYPSDATVGVVLIAGGDQYRVGSHRLFVQLARSFATAGIAVMRYDHRGIGDNRGRYGGFENTFADVAAALEKFVAEVPSLTHVVLCGLCDGASAALMAGHQLESVGGIVLINPWVHSSNLEARVRIEGYYMTRLKGKEFWKKLITGQLEVINSLLSLVGYLIHFLKSALNPERTMMRSPGYLYRMLVGLRRFKGSIMVVLSGSDLVAQEFRELLRMDERWRATVKRNQVQIVEFDNADHSFTSPEQRSTLETQIGNWVRETVNTDLKGKTI